MDFSFSILSPICDSIKKYRDRNAFFINGKYYSYNCFSERISAIRVAIKTLHSDEQVCAIAVHDDLDTYATIIALWMEGKAYVPLHPNQPLERNLNIIRQVDLHYVFDSEKNSAFGTVCGVDVVNTSSLNFETEFIGDWGETSDDKLAYVLFTSGSTGVPKGVCISRSNIAAFMDSFWKTGISITVEDRCLQAFDLTFDVSVQSYLSALSRGACLYTVSYGQVKYLYVASLIQKQRITFGAMAPSMLTYLRPYFGEFDASSLRQCILTAEACPADLIEAWTDCASNVEVYDFYGPTEATVYCTCYKVVQGKQILSNNGVVSIGKPLANVQAIILDEDGKQIPQNSGDKCKGELCVAGKQVTQGYWNNPEKNSLSFFDFPPQNNNDGGSGMESNRFYHTGDLCYWDESGNIMYCGRIDQQAKIQGFRVELGEIEFHAREFFKNEKRVVAIAFQNSDNLTEIALFIESEAIETKPLVEYLRGKMPSYMIPTRTLFESVFPLNKSEKIDRVILKQKLL